MFLLYIGFFFVVVCSQLAETYGNVFSFRFAGDKLVFVCGYKMVKEALVNQADIFVDRPFSPMGERTYGGTGGHVLHLLQASHWILRLCSVVSHTLHFTAAFTGTCCVWLLFIGIKSLYEVFMVLSISRVWILCRGQYSISKAEVGRKGKSFTQVQEKLWPQ